MGLALEGAFDVWFGEAGQKYGVDPLLLKATAWQESRFDPAARSHAGALGLMQIMPLTFAEFSPTGDALDPKESIVVAAKYHAWLSQRPWASAQLSPAERDSRCIAAYNCGPTRLARATRSNGSGWLAHVPQETKVYVAAVKNRHLYYVEQMAALRPNGVSLPRVYP